MRRVARFRFGNRAARYKLRSQFIGLGGRRKKLERIKHRKPFSGSAGVTSSAFIHNQT